MRYKVSLFVIFIVVICSFTEAKKELPTKEPEVTVEELCKIASNNSACIKNFGPLAEKKGGRAPVSYFVDKGAKMARDGLKKANKTADKLMVRAQQMPDPALAIRSIQSCKHNFDLSNDRLGGAPPRTRKQQWTKCEDGKCFKIAPPPQAEIEAEEEINWSFSDALTFTTTCLDELEMAEIPELSKPMEDALSQPNEIIRNLIAISKQFEEPAEIIRNLMGIVQKIQEPISDPLHRG